MADITHVHDVDLLRLPSSERQVANGPWRDCSIDEQNPDDTNDSIGATAGVTYYPGSQKDSYPESWGESRALFMYDLTRFLPPDVAHTDITSAVWHIYVVTNNSTASHSFQIDRLQPSGANPDDWKEDEATWNNYATGSAWAAGGGDMSTPQIVFGALTGTGWKTETITTMITDALQNRSSICSFLLRRDDAYMESGASGHMTIRTEDYGINSYQWHHVRITYTLSGKTYQAFVFDRGTAAPAGYAYNQVVMV